MIARIWRGWTVPQNADAYENLLRSRILPGIRQSHDCKEIYLFRRTADTEVEFVTLLFFDSLDVIRRFAGEDYEVAVVPPEARKLLARFDARSAHYEAVLKLE
jgi:hypothetical protein